MEIICITFGCEAPGEPYYFWPNVKGVRVPGVSYNTAHEALEAAYVEWKKREATNRPTGKE